MTVQTPIALPAYNVAGTPQTFSQRAGEIDVAWRGSDNRLWTLPYRNQRWAAGPTPISGPNAIGDPTVVSTATGTLDVFWEGSDGNLWHTSYLEGYFGSGVWSAPQSLGDGPLQSPPRAVAAGNGVIDIFWTGADGATRTVHDSGGTLSSPVALNTGAVLGALDPVQTTPGTVDVFWRDPAGDLWVQQTASWGAGAPLQLTYGGALSDVSAVSAGDGNADVFFRGGTGQLWHLPLTAGVAGQASPIGNQAIVGRPAAVEPASGQMTVVQQQVNGSLAASLKNGSANWVGPQLLGDGPVGSDPSTVAFASSAINVFWRGQGGDLWYSPACTGCGLSAPTPVLRPAS
jgi:hypothetical protein